MYGVRLNLAEFLGDLCMHKKISLLLLLSTSLVISADHHALKGDKSNKETSENFGSFNLSINFSPLLR